MGLLQQRWCIENKLYWACESQLGKVANRYAHRNGAAVFSFLRTIVMNLLRRGGYHLIREGFPRRPMTSMEYSSLGARSQHWQ